MAKTRRVVKAGTQEKPDAPKRKPVSKKKAPAKSSGGATVILIKAHSYNLGKMRFRKGIPKTVKDKAMIAKLKGKGGMFTIRGH